MRTLSKKFAEIYVICGPLFVVGQKVSSIGKGDTKVPVPHAYFKSVLAESVKGKIDVWSFMLPNEGTDRPISDFLVKTSDIEVRTGLPLWDRLRDPKVQKMLNTRKRKTWFRQ